MKNYIEQNQQRFLDELFDFLRIPSVSADPKFKDDVQACAEFVKEALLKAGADMAEVHQTEGHPIVFAEKNISPELPTILVYGHYDVQPADPYELWDSPPFEPVIKNNKVYARGASDDKGQVYMHIKALETLREQDAFACNIKFLIEGEEEVGSTSLGPFIRLNKEKLACDVVLISDTGILSNDIPCITTGLRGLTYLEVEVTGPNRDLHSGMYGGAVGNPINIMCQMISSLHDENNKVTIPGFYDNVEEVSPEERLTLQNLPIGEDYVKRDLDVGAAWGEQEYHLMERRSTRPTLDVNGIWGGYTGEGAKTVIASKAYAKISMRLVPNQTNEEISKLFEEHFIKIAPPQVKVKVTHHHGGEPAVTPLGSKGYQAADKAITEAWGKKPLPLREGGSIPIVALFENELKINTILMGFGLDEDTIHSPNESYGIFNFVKGTETICYFHKYFAELNQS